MTTTAEAINEWHTSVNSGDPERARQAVGDPVTVQGPRGSGPITPDEFADWVTRSGIRLTPTSWHPVSDDVVVVAQDATWPDNPAPTPVATIFRVAGGTVTVARRLPDLRSALAQATELAAE